MAKRRKSTLRRIINLSILLFNAVFLFILGYVGFYSLTPDIDRLAVYPPPTTAFMEYRKAQFKSRGESPTIYYEFKPLRNISPHIQRAVVAAEDGKFWDHQGFDVESIRAALEKDVELRRLKYGASTITQQVAKNLYLSPSKNPLRKIVEAILAWRLERNLPKERILEIYLNIAEWGRGVFGVEAAAWHHFGKSARDLTLSESARLAAVLPSPLRWNPNGDSRYIKRRAAQIEQYILWMMDHGR